MSSLVSFLLSFLLLYKYGALFVLIFVAAVILPIPTNTLLLATGAFSSQGYFNFFISLVIAVVANVLGDSLGYFLAQKYGRKVLQKLHIKIPSYVEKLEHYVDKHPGYTIFLSRFFGTADSVVNVFSGFAGVHFEKFIFYDFLGNFVSTGSVLFTGYFLGIHWQDFLNLFNLAGWIIFGMILIILFLLFLWYRKNHNIGKD